MVGIEPSGALFRYACSLRDESGLANLEFRPHSIYDHNEPESYDLVILDNVFEHLPDQPKALDIIWSTLCMGGAAYILVPNRLWPVEVHYGLPFLSYLPLPLANWYLRLFRRGDDYTDASYAPTYFSLNRMLRARRDFAFEYVLPAHIELATAGASLRYRLGVAIIRRFRCFWALSKALLVVAKKVKTNANA